MYKLYTEITRKLLETRSHEHALKLFQRLNFLGSIDKSNMIIQMSILPPSVYKMYASLDSCSSNIFVLKFANAPLLPRPRRPTFGASSFAVAAPRVSNSLPNALTNCDNFNYFKYRLRLLILKNMYKGLEVFD